MQSRCLLSHTPRTMDYAYITECDYLTASVLHSFDLGGAMQTSRNRIMRYFYRVFSPTECRGLLHFWSGVFN